MKPHLPFSILFLLFSFSTFGQTKLVGTFCSPGGYSGYCLTLNGDSMFDYSSWSCFINEKGNGIYKIDKKTLTLNFINNDTSKNYFTIKETKCNSNDSITLTFLVRNNFTLEPLAFANLMLTGLSEDTLSAFTDIKGNTTLRFKKPTKEIEITVFYIGFKRISFKMKSDNCNDITLNIASFHDKFVKNGTNWKYEIKKIEKDKLTLLEDEIEVTLTKQKR